MNIYKLITYIILLLSIYGLLFEMYGLCCINKNEHLQLIKNHLFMKRVGYWIKTSDTLEDICNINLSYVHCESRYNYPTYIIGNIDDTPILPNTILISSEIDSYPTKWLHYHNIFGNEIIYIYRFGNQKHHDTDKLHKLIMDNIDDMTLESLINILEKR
jgi:hypothetical protein